MSDQVLEGNASKDVENEKKYFKELLQTAYDNAQKIDFTQLRNLPEGSSLFVFLSESKKDFYPWLLTEAYKKVGESEENAVQFANKWSKHEFEHAAVTDKKKVYGVRFLSVYKHGKFYGMGVQPLVTVLGDLTLNEREKILSAPSDLSNIDKAELGKKK